MVCGVGLFDLFFVWFLCVFVCFGLVFNLIRNPADNLKWTFRLIQNQDVVCFETRLLAFSGATDLNSLFACETILN